jgi:hypothetical protein
MATGCSVLEVSFAKISHNFDVVILRPHNSRKIPPTQKGLRHPLVMTMMVQRMIQTTAVNGKNVTAMAMAANGILRRGRIHLPSHVLLLLHFYTPPVVVVMRHHHARLLLLLSFTTVAAAVV